MRERERIHTTTTTIPAAILIPNLMTALQAITDQTDEAKVPLHIEEKATVAAAQMGILNT